MINPLNRWAQYGEKPDYAGLLTFAGLHYTEDPAALQGVDAAIIGAPMDDLTSDAPGARFGPRAIRAASCPTGPHLEVGIDFAEVLKVVDYGDAPVIPANPKGSHQAIYDTVTEVLQAGAIPIILGGDHSIAEPDVHACTTYHGEPVGLIHFDTHTDTGKTVFGAELSHGTPMYKLVEDGRVNASRYCQIGLRGYWPGDEEFTWQKEHGIRSWFMHDVRDHGIRQVVAEVIEAMGGPDAGPVFLSIDVDVLDPAYAPGTGTPEPGGMTSADLLWAARELSHKLPIVGADVVEVLPSMIASRDITALVADRTVREILTGIALRKRDGA
jgi:agmatinase